MMTPYELNDEELKIANSVEGSRLREELERAICNYLNFLLGHGLRAVITAGPGIIPDVLSKTRKH
jgi:hypothetical protein